MPSSDRPDLPDTELLRLARGSIEYGLVHGAPLPVRCDALPPALSVPGATFTTLRLRGELRGCCGSLQAERPLALDVTHSAFRAAFHDPRFYPLGAGELADISLEVSVLTPLEAMSVTDEADLLSRLTPGTDGLVMIAEGRRATFLPKVWESLPDPCGFVTALKAKCGLPADYWSERIEFQRYRTLSFAENR